MTAASAVTVAQRHVSIASIAVSPISVGGGSGILSNWLREHLGRTRLLLGRWSLSPRLARLDSTIKRACLGFLGLDYRSRVVVTSRTNEIFRSRLNEEDFVFGEAGIITLSADVTAGESWIWGTTGQFLS
jgi:hypothetical protein